MMISPLSFQPNPAFGSDKFCCNCAEIVEKLKNPPENFVLRPDTSVLKSEAFIVRSIQECWGEDSEARPDFKFIRLRLKPMQKGL